MRQTVLTQLRLLAVAVLVVGLVEVCNAKGRSGLVKFYVQRGSTLGSTYYTINTVKSIPLNYLRGGKIHFVTHGWTQNARNLESLGKELLNGGKGPVILVDWSVWSGSSNAATYIGACARTNDVGTEVAQFIIELGKRGFSRSKMHLIGFSLGGKVSAQAGKCLGGKVARITGLDTPLYCFWFRGPYLTSSDAIFVDTIRTTLLSGTRFQQQGHSDFFVRCNNLCICRRGLPWQIAARHNGAVNIFKRSISQRDCQIRVTKACNHCPLPFWCVNCSNTMGYLARKTRKNSKYMVDMRGKEACEQ